nr:MAG TPA: hypothetical protein [Caudoviricetes sp.]
MHVYGKNGNELRIHMSLNSYVRMIRMNTWRSDLGLSVCL